MTFASVGSLGSATSSVSGTTLAMTTASALEAGNVGVILIAGNNISAADGLVSEITSVVDAVGNYWEPVGYVPGTTDQGWQYCNSGGVAAAGCVVSVWFTKAKTTLPASASAITVTFGSSIAAKVARAWEFTTSAQEVYDEFGGNSVTLADLSTTPGSRSFGTVNGHYLAIRAIASENGSSQTVTVSSGWTVFTPTAVGTGGSVNGMSICGEFKIGTDSDMTSNPTISTSADTASLMFDLREVFSRAVWGGMF